MQISIDDRKFIWLAAIVIAILLRKPLIATMIPFLFALALAATIEPTVHLIERKTNAPRTLAAVSGLLIFVLAGGYVALLVSGKVLSELIKMGSLLQKYQRVPVEFAAKLLQEYDKLGEVFDQGGLPQEVQGNILQAVDDFTRAGIGFVTQGINVVLGAVTRVPPLIVILVIALIATYFLIKDKERLIESALLVAPPAGRERLRELQRRIVVDLVGFFKAQVVLLSLTTVVVAVGLILIGVDYWMTLALVAGLLDIIPVLGPGFLLVPWAVGAWTLGQPALAFKLVALFAASFLVRQVFQAKILGDSIGVHPLPMLLALYAGLHFFGLVGVIVAPVLVIFGKGLFEFARKA